MNKGVDQGKAARRPGRAAFAVTFSAGARVLGLIALAFLGSALADRPASAQYSMLDDRPPNFEWRGRIDTDFRHEFTTKSDAGDEFDASRVSIAGEFAGPINESILVGFRTGYSHTSFDFNLDGVPPLDFGGTALPREPWSSLNTIDFLPSMTLLVGSRISIITAVPIRWAAESGSDKNGFAAGISALVRWQVTDTLSVGAGIGVTSQLEDQAETFPLISLRWRISESFEFATEGSWLQGGNATLLWGANESIRLTLSTGYERTRFRLDDNGNAPDRNGIGEVTTFPIEVGLRLQFLQGAFFDFRAGLGVAGRIRVETDSGRKLYDQEYDPAPRLGIRLHIPFGLPSRS